MIDIEKEREAFEEWYENVIGRSLVYKTYDKSYLNSKTQEAWEAWQAAKVQAVPDGFVVVPKDLIQSIHQSCVRCLDIDLPPIFRSTICTIRDEVATLIEAEEPAND